MRWPFNRWPHGHFWLYFSVLHPNIIVHVPSQDLDFQHHMLWSFLCSIFKMKHFFCWFCWYWWNFRPSLFTLSFLYVFLCFILCCMTVVDRGLNMWLIINVFCFSTNPNVLHEVTFGTHMEYPDGSLPSKFNINITKVLMYYMKWPLEHTWSTQTDLFQVSLT